jgi:hypothetical protein
MRIKIRLRHFDFGIDLFLYEDGPKNGSVQHYLAVTNDGKMEWRTREVLRSAAVEPSLTLPFAADSGEFWKSLVDEVEAAAHVLPSSAEGLKGELAATRGWLDDMRKLVFKARK